VAVAVEPLVGLDLMQDGATIASANSWFSVVMNGTRRPASKAISAWRGFIRE